MTFWCLLRLLRYPYFWGLNQSHTHSFFLPLQHKHLHSHHLLHLYKMMILYLLFFLQEDVCPFLYLSILTRDQRSMLIHVNVSLMTFFKFVYLFIIYMPSKNFLLLFETPSTHMTHAKFIFWTWRASYGCSELEFCWFWVEFLWILTTGAKFWWILSVLISVQSIIATESAYEVSNRCTQPL